MEGPYLSLFEVKQKKSKFDPKKQNFVAIKVQPQLHSLAIKESKKFKKKQSNPGPSGSIVSSLTELVSNNYGQNEEINVVPIDDKSLNTNNIATSSYYCVPEHDEFIATLKRPNLTFPNKKRNEREKIHAVVADKKPCTQTTRREEIHAITTTCEPVVIPPIKCTRVGRVGINKDKKKKENKTDETISHGVDFAHPSPQQYYDIQRGNNDCNQQKSTTQIVNVPKSPCISKTERFANVFLPVLAATFTNHVQKSMEKTKEKQKYIWKRGQSIAQLKQIDIQVEQKQDNTRNDVINIEPKINKVLIKQNEMKEIEKEMRRRLMDSQQWDDPIVATQQRLPPPKLEIYGGQSREMQKSNPNLEKTTILQKIKKKFLLGKKFSTHTPIVLAADTNSSETSNATSQEPIPSTSSGIRTTYTKRTVNSQLKPSDFGIGECGLENFEKKSCYMNSVLQMLARAFRITDNETGGLGYGFTTNICCRHKKCLINVTIKTLLAMEATNHFKPEEMFKKAQKLGFKKSRQQDPTEFFNLFMNRWQEHYEEKNIDFKESPLWRFCGQSQDMVKCVECGYKNTIIKPVEHVDLQIKINGASDLQSCINNYFKEGERFEGSTCEGCKRKSTLKNTFQITTAPKFLRIVLHRFERETEDDQFVAEKIQDEIKCDRNIKIPIEDDEQSHQTYKIAAIVSHEGETILEGHCKCIVWGHNESVRVFDDHKIEVAENNDDSLDENAYMLLYERVDHHVVSSNDRAAEKIVKGSIPSESKKVGNKTGNLLKKITSTKTSIAKTKKIRKMTKKAKNAKNKKKDEYELEKIVDVRDRGNNKKEYYVKWKGYPSKVNTWEPRENFKFLDMTTEFEERRKKSGLDTTEKSPDNQATTPRICSPFASSREMINQLPPKKRYLYKNYTKKSIPKSNVIQPGDTSSANLIPATDEHATTISANSSPIPAEPVAVPCSGEQALDKDIDMEVSSNNIVHDSTINSVSVEQGDITNATRDDSLFEVDDNMVNQEISNYIIQQNGSGDLQSEDQVIGVGITTNQVASNAQIGNEQSPTMTPISYPIMSERSYDDIPIYDLEDNLIAYKRVPKSSSLRRNPHNTQQSQIAVVNQPSMELVDNSLITTDFIQDNAPPLISQPSTSSTVIGSAEKTSKIPTRATKKKPSHTSKCDTIYSSMYDTLPPEKREELITNIEVQRHFNGNYKLYELTNKELLRLHGIKPKIVEKNKWIYDTKSMTRTPSTTEVELKYACGICGHLGIPIARNRKDRFHYFAAKNAFITHFERCHAHRPACGACSATFDTQKLLADHITSRRMKTTGDKKDRMKHVALREKGTLTAQQIAEGKKRQKRSSRKTYTTEVENPNKKQPLTKVKTNRLVKLTNKKTTQCNSGEIEEMESTTPPCGSDTDYSDMESTDEEEKRPMRKKVKKRLVKTTTTQRIARRKSAVIVESDDSVYFSAEYVQTESKKLPKKNNKKRRQSATTKQTKNLRKAAVIVYESEDSENSNVDDLEEEEQLYKKGKNI